MRKTVSVVFSDLTGSTALGERLDPESLRHIMGRYFDTVQAALERHGGTVEKFIGDAVMAVFGVPVVHEDDAVRSVRAAVEMREDVARLNAELEREHGIRLVTRTGVNTGEVVVGGEGSAADQRLATGDAVNVAARLEQAAAADEILLGAQTYAAVRDIAVVEAVEPVEAKGKREPLPAWRLVAVRPDVPAFARAIPTPFVGRAGELAELRRAFETVRREQVCMLSTIVGTPGVGKSRLAREFLGSIEGEARVAGRALRRLRPGRHLPPPGRDRPRGRGRRAALAADAAALGRRARRCRGAAGRRRGRRGRRSGIAGRDGVGVPASVRDARRAAAAGRGRRRHPLGRARAPRPARVPARLLERRSHPDRVPQPPRPARDARVLGRTAPARDARGTRAARQRRLPEPGRAIATGAAALGGRSQPHRGDGRGQPALRRAAARDAGRRPTMPPAMRFRRRFKPSSRRGSTGCPPTSAR